MRAHRCGRRGRGSEFCIGLVSLGTARVRRYESSRGVVGVCDAHAAGRTEWGQERLIGLTQACLARCEWRVGGWTGGDGGGAGS